MFNKTKISQNYRKSFRLLPIPNKDTIEQIGNIAQRGDFLFFLPITFIERIIARFSGIYHHCGLCLGDNLFISAKFWKGIDFDLLDQYNRPFIIYKINNITRHEIQDMVKQALMLRGKKYDRKAVFTFPFRFFKSSPDRYFCSEFLAILCILINRIPSNHPERITPTGLANEPFLERIGGFKCNYKME